MTIIIHVLRQGQRELALALIKNAKAFQIKQYDRGQTALHIAIQKNYLEVAKSLLEKGAEINALANDVAYKKMTPLHYAVLTGNLVATRLLLAWGANTFMRNGHSLTAHTLAKQHGYFEIAETIEQHQQYGLRREIEMNLIKKMIQNPPKALAASLSNIWVTASSKKNSNVIDFAAYKNRKRKTR